MTEYTSYDFENARFAFHPSGRVACARLPRSGLPWTGNDGERWGNGALVRDGWTPVREDPFTDAAIKSLVAKRERVLVAKIREVFDLSAHPSALSIAVAVYQGLTEKPRPEGAEGVECALLDADEAGVLASDQERIERLADFLAERGVRVTGSES